TVAERMQMRLAHRGPDDRGSFVSDDRRCALAHTRLSILDLSPAGRQPMGGGEIRNSKFEIRNEKRSARYWIVFNGEIYNYRELREELSEVRGQTSEVGGQGAADVRWSIANSLDQMTDVGSQRSEHRTQETLQTQQTRNTAPWRSNTDTEVILRAYAK